MSTRRGMPIFARTFLLLLAAVVIAHACGALLFHFQGPERTPGPRLREVTALLSSRMPADDTRLQSSVSDAAPARPRDHRDDPRLQRLLADWLDLPVDAVRAYTPTDLRLPPGAPMPDRPPPEPASAGGAPLQGGPPFAGGPMLPPASWNPDAPLPPGLLVAARQADGSWRVVSSPVRGLAGNGARFAVLLGIGLLAVLPLAWWFSRALSAPIQRFAAAADAVGHDIDAPPLRLDGPREIARAAASVNAMQSRIGRLLQERTEMVGAIAHDLRTPLARLAFRVQSLPEIPREAAEADLDEMSRMIETALAFLRDQNRAVVFVPLDLAGLVAEVVADAATTGGDVRFSSTLAVREAGIAGDALALRRMLANLIDNALRYGERARLSLDATADDWVLDVDDDGPGIDASRENELFMPFVRGEGSRNRETGGIGLGLASVRAAARLHGGDVRLHNREGGGLRATVTLPRAAGGPQ